MVRGIQLTTCAKTRCKNTCMTELGCGNTALTICASWLTVTRISLNSAAMPGSEVGGGSSGLPMVAQLEVSYNLLTNMKRSHVVPLDSFTVFSLCDLLLCFFDDTILRDEEIMLIDVDLHT